MQKISNIIIVGAGNVGLYLARNLAGSFSVKVFSRKPGQHAEPLDALPDFLAEADLLLLCVSDSAISEVSEAIPTGDFLIAHVSGATDLSAISAKHKRRGVFYPLMSITASSDLAPSEIPFCLEADNEEDYQRLESLAKALGAQYFHVNTEQRTYLHLAAVLSQNFSNHLYQKAAHMLQDQGLGFKMLLPLLRQSLNRLEETSAKESQTGPARRNDRETILKHLSLINDPETKSIYEFISSSIQKTYEQEL